MLVNNSILNVSAYIENGGENGIRTHERVSPLHAFQACAFNHSATSPFIIYNFYIFQDFQSNILGKNYLNLLFYNYVLFQKDQFYFQFYFL